MSFDKGVKKYGLDIRQKKPAKPPKAVIPAAIFGGEDEDEEDSVVGGGGLVEKEIARQAQSKKFNRETEQMHAAALAEDPNAFSYDEVFNDLHSRKDAVRVQEQVERKPKYIAALLEKTRQREQAREIVFERKMAKERAQEQAEFGDKERFVTRAYREKLEERRKWLEEEKRRDAMEAANDVTKRADLSDLYRNLFHDRSRKMDEEHGHKKPGEGGDVTDSRVASGAGAGAGAAQSSGEKELQSRLETAKRGPSEDGEGLEAERRGGLGPGVFPGGASARGMPLPGAGAPAGLGRYPGEELGRADERDPNASKGVPGATTVASSQQNRADIASGPVQEAASKPRVTEETVLSARERFLSRKKQRVQEK